jgi:glycerophosphoryl diester phosphodiesterase
LRKAITKRFDEQINELGFKPDIYSPHFSLVNAALVSDCHRHHIKLLPWTVNDLEQINSLKALGVDGIITDFPNLFE